tara:strand:+ start:558 stop:1433 length:876 start_codon:yes stop_codon:yes gene_type:complete
MRNVSSLFRFPGGKQKFSKYIVGIISRLISENPNYGYVECFFGSGGIGLALLSHPELKQIWINDKDYTLACLWNAVIKSPDELCDLIKEFKPTPEIFFKYKEYLISDKVWIDDYIKVGFRKLAIHQISYSGLGTKAGGPIGGDEQKSDYKIDCRWNPKNLIRKIQTLHTQLKEKVRICSFHDFQYLLETCGKCIFYLDPPYYNKGEELYQQSFKVEDHARLSSVLQGVESPWLLSYDDCPEIREIYKWAFYYSFDANYTINTSRRKSELLIVSSKNSHLLNNLEVPLLDVF